VKRKREADLTLKDGRHQWNALDWAVKTDRDGIADLVKQQGANI
jgi:hypothetical protein